MIPWTPDDDDDYDPVLQPIADVSLTLGFIVLALVALWWAHH